MKHYLVTILWAGLLLFDIVIGLQPWFYIILSILFIATGVITYLYKSFRPTHTVELMAWVFIVGWLIIIVLGASIEFLYPLISKMPFFVYKHYFSWQGVISILVVSFVFSLFSYQVFQIKAIYVNFFAGILAALFRLLITGTEDILYLIESVTLVIVLCLVTYAIQLLMRHLTDELRLKQA